jgi:hypothetical protein
LNHRHDIASKVAGADVGRQVSFYLRALESLAHSLLPRVSTPNEMASNGICSVAGR